MRSLARYIVSLGWEGFGDRLQSLSYCINLALSRNRILIVNWSDRWFGGFHNFFDLIDVPYLLKCPAGKTHPSIFEHMLNVPADDWTYDLADYRIDDSSVQITVHPGVGFRAFNYNLLSMHLRFTSDTAMEVADEMKRIRALSDLPIVHLRGTDRPWDLKTVQELAAKHGRAALLGDDKKAAEAYLSCAGGISLMAARDDGKPIHKFDNTRQRVIRMLADFCLLHDHGVGTLNDDSLFWQVSKKIDVKRWFEPAPPAVKHRQFLIR